ncbi:MAG: tetratricopeptide repeat protein, partial [Actinobacteria bacterium]|nr:tetratricopeptide repeat protein [Actinomycetota bacterium]
EQGAERLAAGDWTGAQQAFEAASAADPRDARAHLGLAIALAQLGALDRALAEAHLALEFAPDLIAGLLTRGDIRRALRDYAAAITDYETALRLDPSLDAHAGMALALEGQGDLAGAIASLTRAIALRPQDWALVLERSRLYLAANNTAGARTDIEFVLAREPDNPDALLRRAELRRNEGDVTGARADADRVVELYPAASLPHLVRALIRGSAGDAAGALADAEQAVALDPANPVGLRVRASLHHAAGRLREALADYDRALIAEPNDAITLNNRADALLLLGDLESALRDIERAIQLDPRLGIARYTKGQILDALRRPAEAKASYAEAARLGYTPTPEDLARVTPAVSPPAR